MTKPDEQGSRENEERAGGPGGSKKPYSAPRLLAYGSVAKLTQSGGASGVDFMGKQPA